MIEEQVYPAVVVGVNNVGEDCLMGQVRYVIQVDLASVQNRFGHHRASLVECGEEVPMVDGFSFCEWLAVLC